MLFYNTVILCAKNYLHIRKYIRGGALVMTVNSGTDLCFAYTYLCFLKRYIPYMVSEITRYLYLTNLDNLCQCQARPNILNYRTMKSTYRLRERLHAFLLVSSYSSSINHDRSFPHRFTGKISAESSHMRGCG